MSKDKALFNNSEINLNIRKKEAYKKSILLFTPVALSFLVSYYEDLEDYEELVYIRDAQNEYMKEKRTQIPIRFSPEVQEDYAKSHYIKNDPMLTMVIKGYAKQIKLLVEKETRNNLIFT